MTQDEIEFTMTQDEIEFAISSAVCPHLPLPPPPPFCGTADKNRVRPEHKDMTCMVLPGRLGYYVLDETPRWEYPYCDITEMQPRLSSHQVITCRIDSATIAKVVTRGYQPSVKLAEWGVLLLRPDGKWVQESDYSVELPEFVSAEARTIARFCDVIAIDSTITWSTMLGH